MRFFDVVLNVPMNQSFTYREPEQKKTEQPQDLFARKKSVKKIEPLAEDLFGCRVEVRFGNRNMTGFVTAQYDGLPPDCKVSIDKIRPIERVIDEEPLLTPELFDLAKWISHYYLASIGESVFSMIPSGRRPPLTAYSPRPLTIRIYSTIFTGRPAAERQKCSLLQQKKFLSREKE